MKEEKFMERLVAVQTRVRDVCGLYEELRRQEFSVKNVAGDAKQTYVYLDPAEQKDPTAIVASWAEKMPAKLSRSLYERNLRAEKRAKEIQMGLPALPEGPITEYPRLVPVALPKPSVLERTRSFFRKLGF
jgi:hypothetical protein